MGKLVDAIILDITHNGNKETRDDVLRYSAGVNLTTPVANTLGVAGVVDKNNETIRNYMLNDVIDKVLSNTAPAPNYRKLQIVLLLLMHKLLIPNYTEEFDA